MFFLRHALACTLILLGSGLPSVESREIKGQASPGNFILHEEGDSQLSYYSTSVSINSNVPVTVQRYYDDMYLEGEGPVRSSEAKVLVTSDCSATTYVPKVTFGADSVEVNVEGVLGGADMPFLPSSSYEAAWNVRSSWCERYRNQPRDEPPTRDDPPSSSAQRVRGAIVPSSAYGAAGEEERARKLTSTVCNVNVEVLLDGCAHGVDVSAPRVRVMDARLENASSQQNPKDECVYDHEADITFPGPPAMTGTGSLQAPSLDDGNFRACIKAVPGRPFVDSTGSTLQSSPLIVPTATVGEANACSKEGDLAPRPMRSPPPANNNTLEHDTAVSENQILLGEEWTKNAIGEHASVASFAAFSIALMTNGAPPDLVEDSLKAGLDETRHAETSFAIASELIGRKVGPGPLPESTHAFGRDVTALAMAVAREGCVDETLSAFEAAAEVDFIDVALSNGAGGTKYSGIDDDVLVRIRGELRTIALEESGHAALAWRTIRWACGVDPDACDAVERRVLNEEELERAFRRRFGPSLGGSFEILEALEENWRNLYSRIDVPARVAAVGVHDDVVGDSLVALVAKEILRGVMRR